MEKEAYLSQTLEDNKARCLVCQRKCVILDGRKGWCSTQINRGGKLFSLVYGEASSFSINPIEKKRVFYFFPGFRWLSLGTLGCNFRCPGCQNWDIAHWKEGAMRTEYLPPKEAVAQAKTAACTSISWTFNEPTLWFEYTLDSARLARAQGLYTNYVTNGYITGDAIEMIAPFLDVYRVDVKGFSEETYMRIGRKTDIQSCGEPSLERFYQATQRRSFFVTGKAFPS